jgi:hypothetical protein
MKANEESEAHGKRLIEIQVITLQKQQSQRVRPTKKSLV